MIKTSSSEFVLPKREQERSMSLSCSVPWLSAHARGSRVLEEHAEPVLAVIPYRWSWSMILSPSMKLTWNLHYWGGVLSCDLSDTHIQSSGYYLSACRAFWSDVALFAVISSGRSGQSFPIPTIPGMFSETLLIPNSASAKHKGH